MGLGPEDFAERGRRPQTSSAQKGKHACKMGTRGHSACKFFCLESLIALNSLVTMT